MDYESKAISKVVQSGGLESLISQGISSNHFKNPQNIEVWDYLVNHLDQYKTAPSYEDVKNEFGDYEFEVVTDSLNYIKDKFIEQIKRQAAKETLFELGEILDKGTPEEIRRIDETFLDSSRELATLIPVTRVGKFTSMKDRIARYEQEKSRGVERGMRFGLTNLDAYTLGLMDYEYLTIAGPSGLGKTTLGLFFQLRHFLDGYTSMIISLEMSEEEILLKLDGMAAQLKQQAIQAMTLDGDAMGRWEEMANKLDRLENEIIILDIENATSEKIYAEASRWKPDSIMVDYIQLLDAPKYIREAHNQVGHISKQMKRIAKQLKVPVYGLSQTNSDSFTEGAKLTNVSESRKIVHNSDIVLGLAQDEDQEARKQLEIRILKNRRGPKNKNVYMLWDHENSNYREWRPEIDELVNEFEVDND